MESDDLSLSVVVHTWPDDYAITWGTVYTDSNLSDWLVAREDKTDDEKNYEEVEAKPQPQKKEINLRLTLSIPIEGLLRKSQWDQALYDVQLTTSTHQDLPVRRVEIADIRITHIYTQVNLFQSNIPGSKGGHHTPGRR
jgi:hypothetical protein